ncbi:amidohydrolase family protein [Sphingomonas sp. 3P27F8]|uniref:amidohydrolase family protein n=1 Tax=Sphingomonas sp. 3P27F8 TaxID=2502213 RepID=UPI0010F95912|nr:amidohydrolase family protein [Sphingomonas sp. 3P27F8]
MTSKFVDIHPHVVSTDFEKYPLAPLFGKQSGWSKDRPLSIEQFIAAMDEAGVDKAAIVQASTCYGYDMSYVCDAAAQHPGRFTVVGSVDFLSPDAPEKIRYWMTRGLTGLRLFTGGSTAAFDPSWIDDERSYPAWELAAELGVSVCLQTDASGLAQVAGLAKRFPTAKILIDHFGRPDLSDGPPYEKAAAHFALAPYENIYFKLTPRTFIDDLKGAASAETLFPRLVAEFGAQRLAWGSNFPASTGSLGDNLDRAKQCLSVLSAEDQDWIFAKTAQSLYPALKD